MLVKYQGQDYTFDLEAIQVSQAKIIKVQTGYTLVTLEEGLEQADPDALKAIFWLMMIQSGTAIPFERVDFKILEFATALQEATEAEAKEAEAAAERRKAAGEPPKE